MTCRRCRRKAPPGAESCPKCGASLAARVRRRRPGSGHPILDAIARTAARLCEASDAQIILIEGATQRLVAQHGSLRSPRRLGEPFPLNRGNVYGRAALERRVIHIRDFKAVVRTEYPDIAALSHYVTRVRTMLAAPLFSGAAVLGVIGIRRLQVRPFTSRQIALLQTFAAQAAMAIEKDLLSEQLEARNRELTEALDHQTATGEVLGVISASPTNVQSVFETIVSSARRLCEASFSSLNLLEGGKLMLTAVHGFDDSVLAAAREAYPQPVDRTSTSGRAILERRVIHIEDSTLDPEYTNPVRAALGLRCVLTIPLLREGQPLGAVSVWRSEVRPFTEKQIALLQTFADQAVIAIENARLFGELTEALEQQTATAGILRAISTSTMDVQPVFQTILEAGVRLSGALFGSVYRFDGTQLDMVAHHNYPAAALEFSLRTFPAPPTRQLVTGRAILERSAVHVPDVLSDAERSSVQQFAGVAGFRSALSVPMLRDGQPIGAITLWHSAPFSDTHIALLTTFADQAVIAVENVRLFKELEARNRDLTEGLERETATGEILRVISSSPTDIQPVLEAILDSGKRLCDAEFGAIFRFDGDAFVIAASTMVSSEFSTWLRSHPVRPGPATPLARVGLERRPAQVADILADLDFTPPDIYRREGMRTALAVPMLKDGALVGALTFHRLTVQPFTDQQIALLETFAAQAVIAIENVRLFTELDARNHDLTQALEQQTATAEVLRVIGSSPTDAQPVFDAIVSSAWRLLGGFGGAVYRVVGDELHLTAYISTNPSGDAALQKSFPRPLSVFSPPGEAIRRGAPVILSDIETAGWIPDDISKLIRERGDRSGVWVPMMREGVALGAIGVTRSEPGGFSDEQIALLRTFADQAVIAIENVRLFTELQEKNRALTQAHAQVTETLEQQTATSEILRTIAHAQTDARPVFDTIVNNAARLCHATNAAVFLTDGRTLYHPANFGSSSEALAAARARYPRPLDMDSVPGVVILTRSVVHVPDIEDPAAPALVREAGRLLGFRSTVALPMLRGDEAVGSLNIGRREPGRFSDAEVQLLKTFADQAVIAIENVRLFKELEARNRDLTEALEQQTATAEILRVISTSPTNLQPVLDTVVASAARFCGAYDANLLRVDGERLKLAAHHGPIPIPVDFSIPLVRETVGGRSVLERRALQIADIQAEAEEFPEGRVYALPQGTRTLLSVPLLREGAPLGAIALRRTEVDPFTDKQIALLQTFADQAVIAIENVRLFTELGARNRDLTQALEQQTATAEVLSVIGSSPTDTQPVFDAIVHSARRLLGGFSGAVFRRVDDDVHVAAYTTTPSDAAPLTSIFPRPLAEFSGSGDAIRTGTIIVSTDLEADPRMSEEMRAAARVRGFRSAVWVPMLREGSAIGAIGITRSEPGAFADEQIALLKTFADQAVIAVENVRLFRELQARTHELTQSVEQLTALGEVSRAVTSTLDVETVLETVVSRARQLAGADGCLIYEYDEGSQQFHSRATDNLDAAYAEALRGTPLRKGEGVSGRAAEVGEAVQVADITQPSAYQSSVRHITIQAGYRAVLSVPLLREDEIIGSLILIRKTPGEFPAEIVELLKTFATQSALAIQNARLFREIEDKGRELELASKHKSQFLANMSHELRTPLNAILGYTELLLDGIYGEVPEKARETMGRIERSGRHLLALINDVLDLSKIEAGQLTLSLADYSLAEIVNTVVTAMEPLAAEKGLALRVGLDPGLPLARGDDRRLSQVLLNLVGNAVKFTDAGEVRIEGKVSDGAFLISVSDSGPGIAVEDQARIFDEFQQVDASNTRKKGGTGLGLSIARRILALHGGRIWVESAPGKGATFFFTLPVRVERMAQTS